MALNWWARLGKGGKSRRTFRPVDRRRRLNRTLLAEALEDRNLPSSGRGGLGEVLSSSSLRADLAQQGGPSGGRQVADSGSASVEALLSGPGSAEDRGFLGNGGKGSFSSGPGYPLPPAVGPALRGDLTTPATQTTLSFPIAQSALALVPVVLDGGSTARLVGLPASPTPTAAAFAPA